jgi:hypothetical protein
MARRSTSSRKMPPGRVMESGFRVGNSTHGMSIFAMVAPLNGLSGELHSSALQILICAASRVMAPVALIVIDVVAWMVRLHGCPLKPESIEITSI